MRALLWIVPPIISFLVYDYFWKRGDRQFWDDVEARQKEIDRA